MNTYFSSCEVNKILQWTKNQSLIQQTILNTKNKGQKKLKVDTFNLLTIAEISIICNQTI